MARKWKRHKAVLFQQPPQQSDVNMIEKSIKKHEEVKTYTTYPNANNGRQHWTKIKYDSYISEQQKLGFVLGTSVITKYGIMGKIIGYKECPDEGISFYGGDAPCCVNIDRDDGYGYGMIYGFNELTIRG